MDASSSDQPLSINTQIQASGRQIQFQKSQLAVPSTHSPEISGSTGVLPPEDFTNTRKHSSNRKNRHTWSKDTCYLTDDGFQWRKYGQKDIQNEKYPRNYFRCTHKDDQGCLATKQVQRIQQDPPIYRSTYYGHHTCETHHTIEEIFTTTCSNSNGGFSLVIPNGDSVTKESNSKLCSSNSTSSFNLLIPPGKQKSNSTIPYQHEQVKESMEKSSVSDPTYNGDLKLLQTAEPLNLTLSLSLSL